MDNGGPKDACCGHSVPSNDAGVQIHYVNPIYTSQRCSQCGWVRKTNRKGKRFKCDKCGYEHDADLNAAVNVRKILSLKFNKVSLPLLGITQKQRLRRSNVKGFYWNEVRQDLIVPVPQEAKRLV